MNPSFLRALLVTAALSLLAVVPASLAQNPNDPIIINPPMRSAVTKISLTGFTGEALSTIKFDLEVLGCEVVSADNAQYVISGSSTDHIEGRVQDRLSQAYLLGKAYSGGDIRLQAHKFADDISKTVFKLPGIALTKIAYKVTRGQTSEICIADYDGHRITPVTADNTIVAAPAWAPNHRKLYFTSYRLGNPDIYSQDLDTGERRIVARYTGLNTSAAVSPDGSRLAMILSKSGSCDVWMSDAAGGNLKQLTTTHEDESSPCWSPDGKTLCFTSRQTHRAALYKISTAGGAMQRLSTEGAINCTEPDWSPDGKYIAFTSLAGSFRIFVLEVATGKTALIAEGEDPTWAPNSRTLCIARRVGGKYVLSLLDVRTKRVKDIPQLSGNCSQPAWAR